MPRFIQLSPHQHLSDVYTHTHTSSTGKGRGKSSNRNDNPTAPAAAKGKGSADAYCLIYIRRGEAMPTEAELEALLPPEVKVSMHVCGSGQRQGHVFVSMYSCGSVETD